MDTPVLIIVIFLFLIIIILMGIVAALLFLFFKQQKAQDDQEKVEKPKGKIRKVKFEPIHGHCTTHKDVKAAGLCNICEKSFCEECLHTHESLNFCHEHYPIFLGSQWEEVTSVHTTPDEPERGTFIYQCKKEIWEKESLPTYLQTHYKINPDTDQIESIVCLYAPKDILQLVKERLTKFKTKSDRELSI